MITHENLVGGDLSDWRIHLASQFELTSGQLCEAIFEGGECGEEGRVEVVSRDWEMELQPETHLFCFDCAIQAISETIWKEAESG